MKKRKTAFYIIIAIFLVIQIYSISRINSLNHQLNNLENTLMYYQDSVARISDGISQSVKSALEQQASILTSCSYEIGEPDIEELKVPVTFHVQPKTLSNNTAVSLKFGNDLISMERAGSEFILTREFGFKDKIYPTVVIEENGVSQVEENNNLHMYNNLKSMIFPEMSPQFSGSRNWSGRSPYNYKIKGSLFLENYQSEAICENDSNVFTEAEYSLTLDGKELLGADIDLSSPDLVYGIIIDESFKVETGQTLCLTVFATDSLGFIHEYPVFSHHIESDNGPVSLSGSEKITAPDGTVIFNDTLY